MEKPILFQNIRLMDPANGRDAVGDLLLAEGHVAAFGRVEAPADAQVLDGSGLCAAPGLIDIHVHFRDPGQTHKEDLATGAAAAAAGGFTTVLCMPNTSPVCDNTAILTDILSRAKDLPVHLLQSACLTGGMKGNGLCDYAALKAAGAAALTDDGRPVEDQAMMEEAVKRAAEAGLPVVSHCEDLAIINGGIIHKGSVSEELGVKGMDRASEDSITRRECDIAQRTGCPVHICHVSTAGAADAVRRAKAAGAPVTCETASHYLLFTHEKLRSRNANFRMNPPLREESDRLAMLQAVADGTVDAIITDHAPHAAAEKADFEKAPNGVIGLEPSLAGCITALVEPGIIPLMRLLELMTVNPARILGLPVPDLQPGAPADLVIFDPTQRWVVDPAQFHSKSKNTVFAGETLTGRVKYTILGGRIVYRDNV